MITGELKKEVQGSKSDSRSTRTRLRIVKRPPLEVAGLSVTDGTLQY